MKKPSLKVPNLKMLNLKMSAPKISMGLSKTAFTLLGVFGFYLLLTLWLQIGADQTAQKRLLRVPRVTMPVMDLLGQQAAARLAQGPLESQANETGEPVSSLEVSDGEESVESVGQTQSSQSAVTPLTPAPVAGLMESGPFGPLPKISEDGREPWRIYAQPRVMLPPGQPRIAVVVTNLGLNKDVMAQVTQLLPSEVAVSFSPYALNLNTQVTQMRAQGYEVLVDLPAQPRNYEVFDPGPKALQTNLKIRENIERLQWILSRSQGYIGLSNTSGDEFFRYAAVVDPILEEISKRGVLYLGNSQHFNSEAPFLAAKHDVVALNGDLVVDRQVRRQAILERLKQAEVTAKRRGMVIVFAGPYSLTLRTIADWAEGLEGVSLVPLSTIARDIAPTPRGKSSGIR